MATKKSTKNNKNWTEVDPKTPAAELVKMVTGKAPVKPKKPAVKKKVVKKKAAPKKKKVIKSKTIKGGRPSSYTPALAAKLCAMISDGMSMRQICRAEDMPSMTTVFNWLGSNDKFLEQYTLAKGEMVEAFVEDMIDIADNQVSQPLLVDGIPLLIEGKPVMMADAVSVNHARLRIDTRKFVVMKLKPKKYGEKIGIDHDVSDPMKELMGLIKPTLGPPSKH